MNLMKVKLIIYPFILSSGTVIYSLRLNPLWRLIIIVPMIIIKTDSLALKPDLTSATVTNIDTL
jgi:hypothetical protein